MATSSNGLILNAITSKDTNGTLDAFATTKHSRNGKEKRASPAMRDLSPTLKRILDLAGASFGLAVFGIPMMIVAGLIRLRMGRPVLYRVIRPGLRDKPFLLYKFRTMREVVNGGPLSDKERITPLGKVLRKSSLDELPQLINVLKGDMSLVGPRPLKMEYVSLYTPRQARRHDVKPGITGLAQIQGRNRLSWDEKFALDVWYVEHASLFLDLRILLQTIVYVIRGDSVSSDGDLDVPAFTGSLSPRRPESALRDVPSQS